MNRGKNLEIAVLNQISQAAAREGCLGAAALGARDSLPREALPVRHGDAAARRPAVHRGFARALRGGEEGGRYRLGEGITGQVALSGRPRIIPDVSLEPEFLDRTSAEGRDSHVAFICVPITHLDEVIGTLSIDREMAFTRTWNAISICSKSLRI